MPTWVLVRAPQGNTPMQPVFVNRRFNRPAGRTGTPFQVAVGVNTFSLRSPTAIIAESVVDCPDMPQAHPFLIALTPIALGMESMSAPVAGAPVVAPPAPKTAPKAKKARKKSAKPKAAKPKAKRPKIKRPKTGKQAAKRKVAKRKAPKAPKRKAARKTAARRKLRT